MYFVHYHPSGNHRASLQDVYATFAIKQSLHPYGINVLGHVIIDKDKFSYLDAANKRFEGSIDEKFELQRYLNNQVEILKYKNLVAKLFSERVDISMFDGQEWLVEISKALLHENGYAVAIIYLSQNLQVAACNIIPVEANEAALARIIKVGISNNLGIRVP